MKQTEPKKQFRYSRYVQYLKFVSKRAWETFVAPSMGNSLIHRNGNKTNFLVFCFVSPLLQTEHLNFYIIFSQFNLLAYELYEYGEKHILCFI